LSSQGHENIRIVIVDDHVLVREGLKMLLESEAGYTVVGEATGRAEAMALVEREKPDLVLLDLDLGRENGLDLIPDFLKADKNIRILVLTGVSDEQAHRRALRLGALGILRKEMASEVLLRAVERVGAGEVWLDRSLASNLLADIPRAPRSQEPSPRTAMIDSLSQREMEILACIGDGLSNKKIGERLFISETTVRHHLTSIFSKLEVHDRLELIVFAYRNGLLKPPAAG